MKESLWGYWLVLLGIIIIVIMIFMQNITTVNQQDYYLIKETSYAAMYDSIDFGYYKKNGKLKIIKEKFVENFVRRFAENASLNKTYKINFYSIYEEPPAVSLEIITDVGELNVEGASGSFSNTTRLTALLELK